MSTAKPSIEDNQPRQSVTQEKWQQIDLFFMAQGNVYETLRNLEKQLLGSGISYAIIDGIISASDLLKDLADVQELIRVLNLSMEMASQLDDSVREEYQKLWYAIEQSRQRNFEINS